MCLSVPSISTIRALLEDSLATMQRLGRASVMTYKARRCIVSFLELIDAVDQQQSSGTTDVPLDEFPLWLTNALNNPTSDQPFDGMLFEHDCDLFLDLDDENMHRREDTNM